MFKFYNSSLGIISFAIIGIILGFLFPHYIIILKPIGDIFIALIKMMLIPVILFTLVYSVASLSKTNKALKIGIFTILYFFIISFVAGILGLVIANLLTPGLGIGSLPAEFFSNDEAQKVQAQVIPLSFFGFILGIIPVNPVTSLSSGNIIQVIFFSIFFGVAVAYVDNSKKETLLDIIGVINDAVLWIIAKIMILAPLAVLSLMAYWVASIGLGILLLLGKLFITVLLAGFIWIYFVLGLFIMIFSKVSYVNFIKKSIPVKVMAFGTSSSLVSLPTNMKACKEMGLNPNVYNFILPLGANLHMNGSAIFYSIVTVFFAQMFSIDLDITTYFLIALMASIGSMATPGIPGLSLTIVMVMMIANVPLIGLPIIFAIDRVLDMFITTINVVGDTAAAAVGDKYL